jgi:hypothetical protein
MVGCGTNRQRKQRICGAESAARPAIDLFYPQRGAMVDGQVASGRIGGSLAREEGGCAKGESAAAFGPFFASTVGAVFCLLQCDVNGSYFASTSSLGDAFRVQVFLDLAHTHLPLLIYSDFYGGLWYVDV